MVPGIILILDLIKHTYGLSIDDGFLAIYQASINFLTFDSTSCPYKKPLNMGGWCMQVHVLHTCVCVANKYGCVHC